MSLRSLLDDQKQELPYQTNERSTSDSRPKMARGSVSPQPTPVQGLTDPQSTIALRMLPRVPAAYFPAGWYFGDGAASSAHPMLPNPQMLPSTHGLYYGQRNDALLTGYPPLMFGANASQYGTLHMPSPSAPPSNFESGIESSSPPKPNAMDALTKAAELDAQIAPGKRRRSVRGGAGSSSDNGLVDEHSSGAKSEESDSDYEYPQSKAKRRCVKPQQQQTSSAGLGRGPSSAFVPLQQRALPPLGSLGTLPPNPWAHMFPPLHDVPYSGGFHLYAHSHSPAQHHHHSAMASSSSMSSSSHAALMTQVPGLHLGNFSLPSPTASSSSSSLSSPASLSSSTTWDGSSALESPSSSILISPHSNKHWAFRHAHSEWSKYDWHVRSGGRYIMTERAHRRYFACDVIGCNAVLYEDSPAEARTGEIIEGGALKMSVQRGHNHPPPTHPKPNADLLARAYALLKIMPPAQVRDTLIIEAGNGIGIPSLELLQQCSSRSRTQRSRKSQTSPPHHSSPSARSPPSPPRSHA